MQQYLIIIITGFEVFDFKLDEPTSNIEFSNKN